MFLWYSSALELLVFMMTVALSSAIVRRDGVMKSFKKDVSTYEVYPSQTTLANINSSPVTKIQYAVEDDENYVNDIQKPSSELGRYLKISDVLSEKDISFHAAISSHLFSPISVYQNKIHQPYYNTHLQIQNQYRNNLQRKSTNQHLTETSLINPFSNNNLVTIQQFQREPNRNNIRETQRLDRSFPPKLALFISSNPFTFTKSFDLERHDIYNTLQSMFAPNPALTNMQYQQMQTNQYGNSAQEDVNSQPSAKSSPPGFPIENLVKNKGAVSYASFSQAPVHYKPNYPEERTKDISTTKVFDRSKLNSLETHDQTRNDRLYLRNDYDYQNLNRIDYPLNVANPNQHNIISSNIHNGLYPSTTVQYFGKFAENIFG